MINEDNNPGHRFSKLLSVRNWRGLLATAALAIGVAGCSGDSTSGVEVYEGVYAVNLIVDSSDLIEGNMVIERTGATTMKIKLDPNGPEFQAISTTNSAGAVSVSAGETQWRGTLTPSQDKYVVLGGKVYQAGVEDENIRWTADRQ